MTRSSRRTDSRLLTALGAAFGAVLLSAAPVAAHAELLTADPAPNSSVTVAPTELRLTFTEAVDPTSVTVEVRDGIGALVVGVGTSRTGDSGEVILVSLPVLEPDTYSVTYSIISDEDGHPTGGVYAFLFDPTGQLPPPGATPESTSPPTDPWAVFGRLATLLAVLVLIGLHSTWFMHRRRRGLGEATVPVPWLAMAGLAVAAFAGLALYLTRTAAAGGLEAPPGFTLDIAAPFGSTSFAKAMRIAAGGTVALLLVCVTAQIRRPSPAADGPWLAASFTAVLLTTVGLALGGHAFALGGYLGAVLDTLHQLGVGAWLGALPAVALIQWRGRRLDPDWGLRAAWIDHGRLAMIALPLVVVSGLLNSPLVLGSSRAVLDSTTGNLLVLKVALLSLAASLGAVNFLLVRRGGFRSLARTAAVETGLGITAVLAAALLVTGSPASAAPPAEADSSLGSAHLFGDAGTSRVHLIVEIPAPGIQSYRVTVTDRLTGADRTDVEAVYLSFHLERGLPGDTTVEAAPTDKPGLFGVRGDFLVSGGVMDIGVTVQRHDTADESVVFPVPVHPDLHDTPLPPSATGFPLPGWFTWAAAPLPAGWAGWLAPIGLLTGVAAVGLARRRQSSSANGGWLAMVGAAGVVLAVVIGLGLVGRDAVSAVNRPPASEAARVNPLDDSGGNTDVGASLYQANCASCHGPSGAGDGALSDASGMVIGDLAEIIPERTDGELNWSISAGRAGTQMPAFGTTLLPYERWEIVSFLRSQWPALQGD
jgi:copper transport protein